MRRREGGQDGGGPARSPRRRRTAASGHREAALAAALRIASLEGLNALSFGRVAEAAGLPKSTVQTMFGERAGLQRAVFEAGADMFRRMLEARLAHARPAERLRFLTGAWLDFVGARTLPGGCLVTASVIELRGATGPLAGAVAEQWRAWRGLLAQATRDGVAAGRYAADVDPEQAAFEIAALQMAANQAVASGDAALFARARRAFAALLQELETGGPRFAQDAPQA